VFHVLGSLFIGAAAGEGARRIAWRPLLKSTLREGVRLSRNLHAVASKLRSEAEILIGEVRAELDAENAPRPR